MFRKKWHDHNQIHGSYQTRSFQLLLNIMMAVDLLHLEGHDEEEGLV